MLSLKESGPKLSRFVCELTLWKKVFGRSHCELIYSFVRYVSNLLN